MLSANAWILVKMQVETEPWILWNNLQLIYLSYQKRYQNVTSKEGEHNWSALSNDFAEDHLVKIHIVSQLFYIDITYKT